MIEVVAGLIQKENEFLIAKRAQNKARGGLWEFVGGKVEKSETRADALKRELKEELGIIVSVSEEIMTSDYAYPDVTVRLTLLKCEILEGNPRAIEHEEIKWITKNELKSFDFCPADMPFLPKIEEIFA